jgi:hypothetical protein
MTALRDIVVVLDDATPSEIRLHIAVALAQQHDAYLTGLSALDLLMPTRPVVRPRGKPSMMDMSKMNRMMDNCNRMMESTQQHPRSEPGTTTPPDKG